MKKPVFPHSNTVYTISWILTVPILIDISTACTLFSFWVVWLFYFLVLILSSIRLVHGFAQKCYKFCWGLISQLLLGAALLAFFQLSFNNVIHTPFSHQRTPDIVEIENPILEADSVHNKDTHDTTDSSQKKIEHIDSDVKKKIETHRDIK